jgi:suppressor for copper-sensitivity B
MTALIVWLALVRAKLARRGVAAALVAAALVVTAAWQGTPEPAVGDALWRPFDARALGPLVQGGQIVFVDVTADWCLTCKVNERLVLEAAPVRSRLAASGVVAMRADWTRPDEAIAQYLRRFGRYGIPFNAVYGPGAPAGVALPEILTEDAVQAALRRAAGTPDGRG